MAERDLTRSEVVAMWLWGNEYAKSGMSAIEWYRTRPSSRKRTVGDFVLQYEHARERDLGAPSGEEKP